MVGAAHRRSRCCQPDSCVAVKFIRARVQGDWLPAIPTKQGNKKKKKENGIIGLVRCVKRPGEKMESHMMPVKISIAGCPSLLLGRIITLFPSHPMAFYHLLS